MSVILHFRPITVLSSKTHVSAACARGSRNRNDIEGFPVIFKVFPGSNHRARGVIVIMGLFLFVLCLCRV